MKKFLLLTLGSFALLLSACGTEDGGPATISTVAPPAPSSVMEALFEPSSDPAVPSIVPAPNNAAFAGSTDGTLNLKDAYGNPYTDISLPQGAMNALDGFSTVAPMTTSFAEALDSASIAAAVHVYDGSTGAELSFGQDYVAIPNPTDAKILVIKPIKPLKGATNYLVVVTSDLQSATGKPAAASKIFTLMKSPVPLANTAGVSQIPGVPDANAVALEGLRQTVKPALDVAQAHGITKDKVAVAWSFKTQTLGKVLKAIQAASAADPYASNATNLGAVATAIPAATFAAGVGLPISAYSNLGSVVTGAVQLPYYLDEYSAANPNPLAPLTSVFQMDAATGLPVVKSVQNVNYLLTIPNTAGPWKVAIFQHGFTVDKTAIFGIANTLASAGYATIAIDAVLHGDRTFGLDLVNNTTGAPGSDTYADASGTHYLNLTSLLTSRDNIRQSVADLIHLANIVKVSTLDVVSNTNGAPGADAPDLDTTVPLVFVGHSNGGILGTVLAGVMPATDINKYVLANPGGDYATILQNSGAFSPVVNAGLAGATPPVLVGTPEYAAFFFAAQTVVDDGDPLNYAALAASKGIFLLKTTPDGVVPNAQTDALSLNLGLKQVSGNLATQNANAWALGVVASPQAGNGFVNYTAGSHSSFLDPTSSAAATTAMQTDTATFLVGGAVITSDTAVTE